MDPKRRTHVSKFLSLHLRHRPEGLGLTLAPGGWVPVAALLSACARKGLPLSRAELDEVVAQNDKQRFAFDEAGEQIRASQGHSVEVDLGLGQRVPPLFLYHGTFAQALPAIEREGLRKMARHHVHLSADVATARKVGGRRGPPVVLIVDAAGLHRAGAAFFCSDNGVWLVDEVPPPYLRPMTD